MKKINLTLLFTVLLISLFVVNTHAANDNSYTYRGSTYQVTDRKVEKELSYGIDYFQDKAVSNIPNTEKMDPQSVNVVEVPTSTTTRVVNWTYQNSSGWVKQTVKSIAKNYESNNPGWVVITAINGDFFDIGGSGTLPYQTSGVAVCDGDVIRPINSSAQVGFKNDGSKNPFMGNESKYEYEKFHTLDILDDDNNVIKSFVIDKLNDEPVANEISVYYSYGISKDKIEKSVLPAGNSFLVSGAIRCLGMNDHQVFAKGVIDTVNTSKELALSQFGIRTDNQDVLDALEIGKTIRVQQNVKGDFANCTDITGAGAQLINEKYEYDPGDGRNGARHPRTTIGVKEDGTIVLATIDGRQQAQNMYGMWFEEMGAMMKYYGCIDAYNLDGGGSTTMLIRNSSDELEVVNSPSDGEERRDSNAILVVAPEINFNVNSVSDTQASISYSKNLKKVSVSNVVINYEANGKKFTKEFQSDSIDIDNLTSKTTYNYTCTYNLTYKGNTIKNTTKVKQFVTGKEKPKLLNYYYREMNGVYLLFFELNDPENTMQTFSLGYDRELIFLKKSDKEYAISKTDVKVPEFIISIDYNLDSTPNQPFKDDYVLKLKDETVTTPPTQETPKKESGCSGCKDCFDTSILIYSGSAFLFVLLFRKKH